MSHLVHLAKDNGWERLSNGDLLNAAEQHNYEIFITADQSIRFQQNLEQRSLGVLVLIGNAWPRVRDRIAEIQYILDRLAPGDYVEIEI